jgi:hypothetical protein
MIILVYLFGGFLKSNLIIFVLCQKYWGKKIIVLKGYEGEDCLAG